MDRAFRANSERVLRGVSRVNLSIGSSKLVSKSVSHVPFKPALSNARPMADEFSITTEQFHCHAHTPQAFCDLLFFSQYNQPKFNAGHRLLQHTGNDSKQTNETSRPAN